MKKYYTMKHNDGLTYTFEIVDKIPKGYQVWNIDFNLMFGGLVPLCEVEKGTYNVVVSTLKAIYVDGEDNRERLKRAVSRGINGRNADAKWARDLLKSLSE